MAARAAQATSDQPSLVPWLSYQVRMAVKDAIRDQTREREILILFSELEQDGDDRRGDGLLDEVAGLAGMDIDECLGMRWLIERLAHYIRWLKEDERVVLMHLAAGVSVTKTMRRLGLKTAEAVYTLRRRARAKVRVWMARDALLETLPTMTEGEAARALGNICGPRADRDAGAGLEKLRKFADSVKAGGESAEKEHVLTRQDIAAAILFQARSSANPEGWREALSLDEAQFQSGLEWLRAALCDEETKR